MDISIQVLRIFRQAVDQNSFSAAARTLGVSQPTVSQQIARLEKEVGAKLFERVGHEIHLTPVGRDVHQMAGEIIERTAEFSERLKDQRSTPAGLVRYAMPESCQWTPHYRKIMAQIRELPDIRFDVSILPNDLILDKLLKGEIDFGFVAGEKISTDLRFEKFSDEHYSLVAADKKLFQPLQQKNHPALRLIQYPGWEAPFAAWAKALDLWKSLKPHLPPPAVTIGSLAGAIHAAQEGAGVAVIPTHCVEKELSEESLRVFHEGRGRLAVRPIYLARRLGERLPRRAEAVIEMLRTAKGPA